MGFLAFLRRLLGIGNAPDPRPNMTPPNPVSPSQSSQTPTPVLRTPPVAPPPIRITRPTPIFKSMNLDASQFAPIRAADALAQASSSETIRSNPWWGRLDTIPPASDERTLLIDRSLVAYGLLKPEELVEIHKIGDKMLEISGDRALAAEQARAAVLNAEADRQKIKEQKKKESADRKLKHAEDVAHRRATDIIFLGRGVSRHLADRRSNIEKLQSAGLPILSSPADVATALGLTIPRLRWLAFHSDAAEQIHYVRFTVPKKSGGTRQLAAPHRELAAAQRWIFQNILLRLPIHPAAHGFAKGKSIRSNAAAHIGKDVLINVDLTDFFPTITFPRVRGAMQQLGYSPAVATVLALLCTEAPRKVVEYAGQKFFVATGDRALPQGACTSPALSNLISRRLDARLTGIATKLDWTYSRYADDLSFSVAKGNEARSKIGYLLARIRHITQEEGFAVNETKTRVQKQSTAMMVTGIVVNQRAGVRRREVRRLRAILHNAKKNGLASQNRENHPKFASKIRGQIAFVQSVNPVQGQSLLAQFSALD